MKRYNSCLALSLLGIATLPAAALAGTSDFTPSTPNMAQYLKDPVFLTASAKPRVMLLFDNSGSMNDKAYENDDDHETTCTDPSYLSAHPDLYGYFDAASNYTLQSGVWRVTSSGTSGNQLNCLYMERIDIARKVLTGGKTDGTTSDGYPILATENGQRVAAADTEVAGVIQAAKDDVSFGLTVFDTYVNGGLVTTPIGGDVDDIVTTINQVIPKTSTPLAESLYTIIGYFQQSDIRATSDQYIFHYDLTTPDVWGTSAAWGGLDVVSDQALGPRYYDESNPRPFVTSTALLNQTVSYQISNEWDPFYSATEETTIDCAKAFVIIVTDGAPTMDVSIPHDLTHYDGDTNDRDWSATAATHIATSGSDYLDDVAQYAYQTDLRPDIDGTQNLEIYPVFAFGTDSGKTLMQQTAENAGGIDNYKDASDGDALSEALLSILGDITAKASSGGSVAVLNSNRSGTGGAYQSLYYPSIEGTTGGEDVEVAWTGEVQALMLDSDGNLREDTNGNRMLDVTVDRIYTTDTDDDGNTLIYLTVDSDGDGRIGTEEDEDGDTTAASDETTTQVDVTDVHYLWQADSVLSNITTGELGTNRSYLSTNAGRNLHTWIDRDNDGVVDAGEYVAFTSGGIDDGSMGYLLGTDTGTIRDFNEDDAVDRTDLDLLINWVRGEDISSTSMRSRTLGTTTHRLGDIDGSSPTSVQAPSDQFDTDYNSTSYRDFEEAYVNRRTMIYAGSNDGIFHAFNGGFFLDRVVNADTGETIRNKFWLNLEKTTNTDSTFTITADDNGPQLGQEMWGYIPYNLLPHLQWLPQSNYQHIYYNNLKPRTFSAKLWGDGDEVHTNGWGTVLVGGMSWGGGPISTNVGTAEDRDDRLMRSAYFVFDITDPEQEPVLLSEFTPDSDERFSFTTVYPDVATVTNSGETDPSGWYLVFGNGPSSLKGESDQNGYLLVRRFKTDLNIGQGKSGHESPWEEIDGSEEIHFDSGEANSFISAPYSADMQEGTPTLVNGAFTSDVIYYGTVAGTFPDDEEDPGTWTGRMHRIVMENYSGGSGTSSIDASSPANWENTVLFDAGRPISTSPAVARDDKDNIWVYFGTGRYLDKQDKKSVEQETFYGLKEPHAISSTELTWETLGESANLIDSTDIKVYSTADASSATDSYVEGYTSTSFTDLENAAESDGVDGWKIDLTKGSDESQTSSAVVVTNPAVSLGVLVFSGYQPGWAICDTDAASDTYGVYYKTGTAYWNPIIGQETETIEVDTDGDGTADTTMYLDRASIHSDSNTASPGLGVDEKGNLSAYLNNGDGTVTRQPLNSPDPGNSHRIYWRQNQK